MCRRADRRSIIGKAAKLEHGGVDLTPVAKVIDSWQEGMVDHEVAEDLKIPVHYVASVRNMLGLTANYRHVSTRSRRRAARAMAEAGQTIAEIASILQTRVEIVDKWVKAATA